MYYTILNDIYSEKINVLVLKYIKNPAQLSLYLEIIGSLDKPTGMAYQQKELGGLALKVKKVGFTQAIEGEVEEIADKYGYLGMFTYLGTPYNKAFIKEKVKELSEKNKDEILSKSLRYFNKIEDNKKLLKKFYDKYKVSAADKLLISVLKEYIYTSIWADDLFHKVPFLLRPFLNEITSRTGITYEQIIQMTEEEIVAALKGELEALLVNEISKRNQDFAFFYEGGETTILVGEQLDDFASSYQGITDFKNIDQIEGQSACGGKAKGLVSILRSTEDVAKFIKGRVLVAKHTSPPYLPAMEKAAAIVTNEGGLLSHAAIVSREFKKPCVVGTKIATEILRDGDLVEVNASDGVIKILKRVNQR